MTRKIIIDTDPGQDDAVALLLALASPEELDILGIVAVAGNVGLAQNAKNALMVVELSGRTDVPVYAGCARPIRRPLVTAEHVHGPTGLDGPDLPDPTMTLQDQHGVDFIVETLRGRLGHGHALHPRAADQRRHGAGQGARHRAAHPRDRDDGRRLFRGRQHHPCGRVQRLCRSGGRRHRADRRNPGHDDSARRHPRRADLPAPPRRLRRPRQRAGKAVAQMLDSPSASTSRNTAARARRCTTPASSPGCSSPICSRGARSTSRSRRRAN